MDATLTLKLTVGELDTLREGLTQYRDALRAMYIESVSPRAKQEIASKEVALHRLLNTLNIDKTPKHP